MLTTGHSFRDHLMPMINGFDEVDLSPEEEAYLRKDQPLRRGAEKANSARCTRPETI
jgi:hypothetical protein